MEEMGKKGGGFWRAKEEEEEGKSFYDTLEQISKTSQYHGYIYEKKRKNKNKQIGRERLQRK